MATVVTILIAAIIGYLVYRGSFYRDFDKPYSTQNIEQIDPALIQYTQTAAFPTGMERPMGMALGEDGLIHVAGDRSIRSLNSEGATVASIELAGDPTALARDGDALLVGLGARVVRVDPASGTSTDVITLPGEAFVGSIAMVGGRMYLADAKNRVVLQVADGAVTGNVPKGDSGEHFVLPERQFPIAAGPGATLYVVNPGKRRIEAYTPDGQLANLIGKQADNIHGFCGCHNPVALAVDGETILTGEKGFSRVKFIDLRGELINVVAGPDLLRKRDAVRAVATDGERVYVLDSNTHAVRVFARKQTASGEQAQEL
ncbi:MAG: hypothetical protein ACOCZK_05590 [Planctomycetota bacterium]